MEATEIKGSESVRKRIDVPLEEWNQIVEITGRTEPLLAIREILQLVKKEKAAWNQIEAEAKARRMTAQAMKEEIQVVKMLREENLEPKKFGQRVFCFTHHIWEDPDSECLTKSLP